MCCSGWPATHDVDQASSHRLSSYCFPSAEIKAMYHQNCLNVPSAMNYSVLLNEKNKQDHDLGHWETRDRCHLLALSLWPCLCQEQPRTECPDT